MNIPDTTKLRLAHEACDAALQELEKLFKPHCKLTLLMRNPESDDGDMLLTRDEFDDIIAAIQRLRDKE